MTITAYWLQELGMEDLFRTEANCTVGIYEGVHLIVALEFLQGALWDLPIFYSFQPVEVFSLDINSVSSRKVKALNADKDTFCGHTL